MVATVPKAIRLIFLARAFDGRCMSIDIFQSRSTLAGSTRVARQAGKKHAANETIVITTNADTKASGSRGLT
jgi:hypothetical protein